jgi:hypothetical protein
MGAHVQMTGVERFHTGYTTIRAVFAKCAGTTAKQLHRTSRLDRGVDSRYALFLHCRHGRDEP